MAAQHGDRRRRAALVRHVEEIDLRHRLQHFAREVLGEAGAGSGVGDLPRARAREVFPWHYPRSIAVRPDDPKTVFLTLGDSTPGRVGTVMRSRDAGATWRSVDLPVQPNSAVWTVAVPAGAPDTVLAASRYGYLYRSDDGGESWRKLWREFGEVSSILWIPRQ